MPCFPGVRYSAAMAAPSTGSHTVGGSAGRALGLAAVAAVAIVAPLGLWRWQPAFIARTYSRSYQVFELFGFSASAAFVAVAIALLRQRRERALPLVALGAVWFHALGILIEGSQPAWDWGCYQDAANAILSGANPYGRGYLYPPLLSQALAFAFRGIGRAVPGLAGHESASIWHLVFYLYQCLQFALVIAAFGLTWRLTRRMGLPTAVAWIVVPALFVLDSPLQRTLKHDQVNLWVLVCVLGGLLSLVRRPALSGLLVAFGAHLKLVPIVVVAPWTLARSWRVLLGSLAGVLAILAIQTSGFRDWTPWREFHEASSTFRWVHAFRDNSLAGLIQGVVHVTRGGGWIEQRGAGFLVVYAVGAAAMLGWMTARFLRRERAARTAGREDAGGGNAALWLRLAGHTADALALTLVLAPVSWEHHYVLAIPIAAWAIAGIGRERPWAVGLAIAMVLAVPTFDVFPFSLHRLAGLLLLLALTPPQRIRPWREQRPGSRSAAAHG